MLETRTKIALDFFNDLTIGELKLMNEMYGFFFVVSNGRIIDYYREAKDDNK